MPAGGFSLASVFGVGSNPVAPTIAVALQSHCDGVEIQRYATKIATVGQSAHQADFNRYFGADRHG